MSEKKELIAVLEGGWSPEREISLLSGNAIAKGFRKLGYDVVEIDVIKDLKFITDELYRVNPDYIYNALHGIGGEDGVVQGILEIFGKPYSHSNVLGSALAFNKSVCKTLAQANGVRVIEGFEISKHELKTLKYNEYPFIIKPSANGSTVGVYLIRNDADLDEVRNCEWTYGDEILIEKFIPGREFTVLLLDGIAKGSTEITYNHELYDYSSKYNIGGSSHVFDHGLSEKIVDDMYSMSEKAYKACKCTGLARADFRYDGENMYFLEINSQPGMTEISLCPDIAANVGISFEEMNCFFREKK